MWPFKKINFNKETTEKYRKWLKRCLLGGWFVYVFLALGTLAMVLVPAVRGQVAEWIGSRMAVETTALNLPQETEQYTQPTTQTTRPVKEEKPAEKPPVKQEEKQTEKKPAKQPEPDKEEPPQEFTVTDLSRPVEEAVITGYGDQYSELYKDYRFHDGLDFKAAPGMAVKGILKGKVAAVTEDPYKHVTVIVEHGSGWKTIYSNLARARVKAGDPVEEGTIVGIVGSAAGDAGKPHVHIGLKHNDEPVDPTPYFDFY